MDSKSWVIALVLEVRFVLAADVVASADSDIDSRARSDFTRRAATNRLIVSSRTSVSGNAMFAKESLEKKASVGASICADKRSKLSRPRQFESAIPSRMFRLIRLE